jgi:hypothetical protein
MLLIVRGVCSLFVFAKGCLYEPIRLAHHPSAKFDWCGYHRRDGCRADSARARKTRGQDGLAERAGQRDQPFFVFLGVNFEIELAKF